MAAAATALLSRVGRLRHYLPLTPVGLALALFGAYLAFSVGPGKLDYVLGAGGFTALAVVAVCIVGVSLCAVGLALRLRRATHGLDLELELETTLTGTAKVALPGLWRWPLVSVRVAWEEPRCVDVTLERIARGSPADGAPGVASLELLTPAERGQSDRIVRRIFVSDVFGFARLGLRHVELTHVRIKPAKAQLTAPSARRFAGGDYLGNPDGSPEGELIEIRRYAHGDPMRYIHWKAFARTRKLLVRIPERAVNPLPSSACYLVAGPGDEPTASVARAIIENNLLGSKVTFSCDGALASTSDPKAALGQIIASVEHRHEGGAGLARFIAELDVAQRKGCILLVPAKSGPWLQRVEAAANVLHGARVILAIDEALGDDDRGRLDRLLFTPSRDRQSLAATGDVVGRLGQRGYVVEVLHLASGSFLNRNQLEALAGRSRAGRAA